MANVSAPKHRLTPSNHWNTIQASGLLTSSWFPGHWFWYSSIGVLHFDPNAAKPATPHRNTSVSCTLIWHWRLPLVQFSNGNQLCAMFVLRSVKFRITYLLSWLVSLHFAASFSAVCRPSYRLDCQFVFYIIIVQFRSSFMWLHQHARRLLSSDNITANIMFDVLCSCEGLPYFRMAEQTLSTSVALDRLHDERRHDEQRLRWAAGPTTRDTFIH